jgi:cyclic pyranopterin phosphate synthase
MLHGHLMTALPPSENPAASALTLRDRRARPLRDLRISVTDRCSFRCSYCMPRTVFGRDYPFLPKSDLLRFEEIVRLARILVSLGVRKIRLTGGEPLLRHDLDTLIRQLCALPGITLALTTNGAQLAARAADLRAAGLDRITVSLDALDTPTFQRMTDTPLSPAPILEGIAAAQAAGLRPVKVNMVVCRGQNDHAVLPLLAYFRGTGVIVRMIEFMDAGNSNAWRRDAVIPSAELIAHIQQNYPLLPIDPTYPGEVAQRWRYADGQGEIGFISSVTQPFCGDCTRLRLSTEGQLYTCLFAQGGLDLRAALRSGATDADIAQTIEALWTQREDRYSELRARTLDDSSSAPVHKIEMSYIGG